MITGQLDLPITLVDSPETLANALPHWFSANILALDIECSLTGFHHCVLALLQVATHDNVWLIDPLAIPELMKPTLTAMASVPWIVHDFSGDGVVFKRLYDVVPSSIMDTMLLARSLGYPQPGLKKMTKIKLGLDISKNEQDSNWMSRPLRRAQVDYAAMDAFVLLPLLRTLAEEYEDKRTDVVIGPRLNYLPYEISCLLAKIHSYQMPDGNLVLDKVRRLGLGEEAVMVAKKITELRQYWGNLGDVAAIMELSNKWVITRLQCVPKTKEDLRKSIQNPHFAQSHIDDLWEVLLGGNL